MAKVAYLDDNFVLVDSVLNRNYDELGKRILDNKEHISYYFEDGDSFYGYNIQKNEPLTKLLGFNAWVVRFLFVNVDTLHTEIQEENMIKLLQNLKSHMEDEKEYYNLRIPTHFMDLVKAYNKVLEGKGYLCGGTVDQAVKGKKAEYKLHEGLKVFFAEGGYIEEHKDEITELAFDTFKTYQGQYHLSPVTESVAGKLYENWTKSSLDDYRENSIIIAEYEGDIVGYITVGERENSVEATLGGVTNKHRGIGAYRAMISFLVNYAYDNEKNFITGTQFDNYIVQGVWNSIGLTPYYSIYNYHLDMR